MADTRNPDATERSFYARYASHLRSGLTGLLLAGVAMLVAVGLGASPLAIAIAGITVGLLGLVGMEIYERRRKIGITFAPRPVAEAPEVLDRDYCILRLNVVNDGTTADFTARVVEVLTAGVPVVGQKNFFLAWENEPSKRCTVYGDGESHRVEFGRWNWRGSKFQFLGPESQNGRPEWEPFGAGSDVVFDLELDAVDADRAKCWRVVVPFDHERHMPETPTLIPLKSCTNRRPSKPQARPSARAQAFVARKLREGD